MKKIQIISIIILLTSSIYSQNEKYLSFELAGSGGIASFNFEKTFSHKEAFDLNYRIGFSMTPIDKNNGVVLIFPVMIHGVFGKTNHKSDIGAGQSFSITTKGKTFLLMPLSCGYRFQPANKNYYLRVAYTPIVSYLIDFQWQHWAGITYAYKFRKK